MDRSSVKKKAKSDHRTTHGSKQMASTITQLHSFVPFSRDQFYDTKYLQRLRSDVQRLENEPLIPQNKVTNVRISQNDRPATDRKSSEVLLPQLPIQDHRSASRFSTIDKNLTSNKHLKRSTCSKIGLSELPSLNVTKKPVTPTPSRSEFHAERLRTASKMNNPVTVKPSKNRPIRSSETSINTRRLDHEQRSQQINHFIGVNGPTRPLAAINAATSNTASKSITHNMETLSISGEKIQPVSPTPSQISIGGKEPQKYQEGHSPSPSIFTLSRRGSEISMISFMNDVPLEPYMASSAQLPTTPSIHYYRASPSTPQTVYLLSKPGSAVRNDAMQMIEYTSVTDPYTTHILSQPSIPNYQKPGSQLSTCDIGTQTPRLELSPQPKTKKKLPKHSVKKITEKRRKDKKLLKQRSKNDLMKIDNQGLKSGRVVSTTTHSLKNKTDRTDTTMDQNQPRKARIVMKTVTHYPRADNSDTVGKIEKQPLSRESTIHIDMTYDDNNYPKADIVTNLLDSHQITSGEGPKSAPEIPVNKPVQTRIIPEIRMICATPDQEEVKQMATF